jgi:predicted transcriptional regulator
MAGMSHSEIARVLGVARITVYRIERRAMRKIRMRLEAEFGSDCDYRKILALLFMQAEQHQQSKNHDNTSKDH